MRVYSSPILANVAIIRDVLTRHGIAAEIRGEDRAAIGPGQIPGAEAWPELWVLKVSQVEEAERIVSEALESSQGSTDTWTCSGCREEIEGQFSECWNCGNERPQD